MTDEAEEVKAVSAIVQKASTQSLADGTTRVVIPMSIALNEDTLPLIGRLMMAVKTTVSLGILFNATQGALDFTETPEAATSLIDHAAAQGVTLTHIVADDGSTYLAHRFAESKDDRDKCAVCDAGMTHDIHGASALNLRDKMREEQDALMKAGLTPDPDEPTRVDDESIESDADIEALPIPEINLDGTRWQPGDAEQPGTGNAAADALIEEANAPPEAPRNRRRAAGAEPAGETPERREPSNEDEAAQQAEAEQALRSRSETDAA